MSTAPSVSELSSSLDSDVESDVGFEVPVPSAKVSSSVSAGSSVVASSVVAPVSSSSVQKPSLATFARPLRLPPKHKPWGHAYAHATQVTPLGVPLPPAAPQPAAPMKPSLLHFTTRLIEEVAPLPPEPTLYMAQAPQYKSIISPAATPAAILSSRVGDHPSKPQWSNEFRSVRSPVKRPPAMAPPTHIHDVESRRKVLDMLAIFRDSKKGADALRQRELDCDRLDVQDSTPSVDSLSSRERAVERGPSATPSSPSRSRSTSPLRALSPQRALASHRSYSPHKLNHTTSLTLAQSPRWHSPPTSPRTARFQEHASLTARSFEGTSRNTDKRASRTPLSLSALDYHRVAPPDFMNCPPRIEPTPTHSSTSSHSNHSSSSSNTSSLTTSALPSPRVTTARPRTSGSNGASNDDFTLLSSTRDYAVRASACERAGRRNAQANAIFCMGILFDNQQSYSDAITQYERFRVLLCRPAARATTPHYFHSYEDQFAECLAHNSMAISYYNMGPKYYVHSLRHHSAHFAAADAPGRYIAAINMGNIFEKMGQAAEATQQHQIALQEAIKLGSLSGQSLALRNLGRTAMSSGDHATARACYERHLQLAEDSGDRVAQHGAWLSLGRLCALSRDFASATECYRCAYQLAQALGDRAAADAAKVQMGVSRANQAMESHMKNIGTIMAQQHTAY